MTDRNSTMTRLFQKPFQLGNLNLASRLIQGPLAGFSCAPFRALFSHYQAPAYCVTEMLSAHDVLYKHHGHSRYLFRAEQEKLLCYQIAGSDPQLMAQAAVRLEALGADLIDLNCGCPKPKIRKKGAGSALLAEPSKLCQIVAAVRNRISIPLTVKIRLQGDLADTQLAKQIEEAGADALIVHGRHWTQDYDQPVNLQQIARIKQILNIPVIANGDIADQASLATAQHESGCDAYMISRAGTGKPWLYQELLNSEKITVDETTLKNLFLSHLQALADLEDDYKAMLQSKSLFRYYFKPWLSAEQLQQFYALDCLSSIERFLKQIVFF
nr:tRNA-dihydrouridine synthase family protein [Legionella jordanis]